MTPRAFRVVVTREDGQWLADMPELAGAHTYAQLCADAGPPTPHEWNHYAFGETQPKVCA